MQRNARHAYSWPFHTWRPLSSSHKLTADPHAGLKAEATPGQWSYTVGPCEGIHLGDEVWLSRYILLRLTEQHNIVASLDPQPVPGDWSGTGAPVKFSTADSRDPGRGLATIDAHVRLLQQAHLHHLMLYGPGNAKRLAGSGKATCVAQFTAGIEDRAASICVPQSTALAGCGHYEDRRPASNMDPYLVTMMLACTTLGIPLPLPMVVDHHPRLAPGLQVPLCPPGTCNYNKLLTCINASAPPAVPISASLLYTLSATSLRTMHALTMLVICALP